MRVEQYKDANCTEKDEKCRACGRERKFGKLIESHLWICINKYSGRVCGQENSSAEEYCWRCARHRSGRGKDITIIRYQQFRS